LAVGSVFLASAAGGCGEGFFGGCWQVEVALLLSPAFNEVMRFEDILSSCFLLRLFCKENEVKTRFSVAVQGIAKPLVF
jgi:hypothetical protein